MWKKIYYQVVSGRVNYIDEDTITIKDTVLNKYLYY